MKLFTLTILTAMILVQNASANPRLKAIKAFQDLAAGVQEMELEHYYIQIHSDLEEIKGMLNGATCKFKKQTATKTSDNVAEIIHEGVSRALDLGVIDHDDGYFSLMESIQEATQGLKKELTGKTVAACEISSTPAYSDGHTLTVVKVSGKVAFAYEVGYPD